MQATHHEIICVLDRSGSMQSIQDDAIGGFNAFIASQRRQPEPALVTLELFDDRHERIYEAMPIDEIDLLDRSTFVPRGSTALLDAIGRALANAYVRINDLDPEDRPSGVIVAILTDGEENSSREFSYPEIAELIAKRRRKDGWEFVYLAANQDAIASAAKLAISKDDAFAFTATRSGAEAAFDLMDDAVSLRRSRHRS
jgi:hypothetical protein